MCCFRALVICCIFINFTFNQVLSNPLSECDKIYSVVIDAGSTGSRVVAYEFQKEEKGDKLMLLREQFNKTRPGLSSYAKNPNEGAKTIIKLVEAVDGFVPPQCKRRTKLFLRATAGLRLLGNETAKLLLDTVQTEFKKTDYLVENHAAGMLSGSDEGMFSWFTVNYLKDALDRNQTFAALEMGGGSAQVTYIPREQYIQELCDDMHNVPYKNLRVFSKSYLGLGINAARDAMFRADAPDGVIKSKQTVLSKCFSPTVTFHKFEFNNTEYLVSGYSKNRKRVKTNQCKQHVIKNVLPLVKPQPLGLSEEQSVAVSAFYYRGAAAKLIVGDSGNTTLGKIWERAEEKCAEVHVDKEDPYLCMDLIYIYTLLKDGYKLKDENKIEMILKLDNHELSWALGFAYSEIVKQYDLSRST